MSAARNLFTVVGRFDDTEDFTLKDEAPCWNQAVDNVVFKKFMESGYTNSADVFIDGVIESETDNIILDAAGLYTINTGWIINYPTDTCLSVIIDESSPYIIDMEKEAIDVISQEYNDEIQEMSGLSLRQVYQLGDGDWFDSDQFNWSEKARLQLS